MINETDVKWIVGTYDLPQGLEGWVTRIAIERLHWMQENFYTVTFDGVYKDIARVIDSSKIPYSAKPPIISLDSPIAWGSKNTLHGSIGSEVVAQESREGMHRRLSFFEALGILEGYVDALTLDLVKQLLYMRHGEEYKEIKLPASISAEQIAEHSGEICERLDELVERYERSGNIVIPPRPIIAVQFKPLSVKFGKRRYHGNPFALFTANRHLYKGMSRADVKTFDSGMHEALRTHDQLDIAIPELKIKYKKPERKPPYSPEEIAYIRTCHARYGGKSRVAERNEPYSHYTFLKYWKGLSIEENRGRIFSQEEEEFFVNAHTLCQGNTLEAVRRFGYSSATWWRKWKAAGLQVQGNQWPIGKRGGNKNGN